MWNFQKLPGLCPGPRWGSYSATQTPSWRKAVLHKACLASQDLPSSFFSHSSYFGRTSFFFVATYGPVLALCNTSCVTVLPRVQNSDGADCDERRYTPRTPCRVAPFCFILKQCHATSEAAFAFFSKRRSLVDKCVLLQRRPLRSTEADCAGTIKRAMTRLVRIKLHLYHFEFEVRSVRFVRTERKWSICEAFPRTFALRVLSAMTRHLHFRTTTLAKKIETTAHTWRRRVISRACTRLCLACVPVSIFLARVVQDPFRRYTFVIFYLNWTTRDVNAWPYGCAQTGCPALVSLLS